MEIQTMSIVVGGPACNAKCPYCISKMTGLDEVIGQFLPACPRNLPIALSHAKIGNVTTILLTSKGEPTLYPEAITKWLEKIYSWETSHSHMFPYKELQTNGIAVANEEINILTLHQWYNLGLTTISISVAHYGQDFNRSIFTPDGEYFSLTSLIEKLQNIGFNVRLNCTLLKDGINNIGKVQDFIRFLPANQITFRPMRVPSINQVSGIYRWAKENLPEESFLKELQDYLDDYEKIMKLAHGACIYDVNGKAVCLSDCLTKAPDEVGRLRQLILYGDGRLTYDWQYKAAQLLPPEK